MRIERRRVGGCSGFKGRLREGPSEGNPATARHHLEPPGADPHAGCVDWDAGITSSSILKVNSNLLATHAPSGAIFHRVT